MTPRIIIRPAADAELDEIARYISRDDLLAAERFLRAADDTFLELAGMPGMGRRWPYAEPEFEDVRVWPIPRFRNYLVCYRPIKGGIEVLHVLHAARDIPAILQAEDDE